MSLQLDADEFRPNYLRVWRTFLRNSLVRELTFRGNFIIEVFTRAFWFTAQMLLFHIIYRQVPALQDWTRYEYFGFMATGRSSRWPSRHSPPSSPSRCC